MDCATDTVPILMLFRTKLRKIRNKSLSPRMVMVNIGGVKHE